VILWKTHKKLSKKIEGKENSYSGDTLYGEYEEAAVSFAKNYEDI